MKRAFLYGFCSGGIISTYFALQFMVQGRYSLDTSVILLTMTGLLTVVPFTLVNKYPPSKTWLRAEGWWIFGFISFEITFIIIGAIVATINSAIRL